MAADVAAFVAAVDKVYGNFSEADVPAEPKDVGRSGERARTQYLEKKFQEQLQRARAAFLQEFRNHSVVVECEVRKIREELTQALEEKYGEKMERLKQKGLEAEALVAKLRDEVAHLKGLVTSQESYLVAVRHHAAQEDRERQGIEIKQLRQQIQDGATENSELSHQLTCRDELVAQLRGELSKVEGELRRQVSDFAQEKRGHDDVARTLKAEMRQQRQQFESRMETFQEQFEEYKAKSAAELRVQEILNLRRAEALRNMEEERQRHMKARAKPSQRIGQAAPAAGVIAPVANPMLGSAPPAAGGDAAVAEVEEARYEQYLLAKDTRYRVDDMGMDTAWRDYRLSESHPAPSARQQALPKFRVERARKAGPLDVGPHAPVATEDTMRPQPFARPVAVRQLELPVPPHTAR